MYSESLGRWRTADLLIGLAYLARQEGQEHPIADIARQADPIGLKHASTAQQDVLVSSPFSTPPCKLLPYQAKLDGLRYRVTAHPACLLAWCSCPCRSSSAQLLRHLQDSTASQHDANFAGANAANSAVHGILPGPERKTPCWPAGCLQVPWHW